MPADAPNMAGQSARITMLHMLQAQADPQGNLNINVGQIAITHGNVVTAWAKEMHRQAEDKEKHLDTLTKLKSGELTLAQITVTDDGVQIKEAQRPSQRIPEKIVVQKPLTEKEREAVEKGIEAADKELAAKEIGAAIGATSGN